MDAVMQQPDLHSNLKTILLAAGSATQLSAISRELRWKRVVSPKVTPLPGAAHNQWLVDMKE